MARSAAILFALAIAAPAGAQVQFRAETTVVYLDVVVRDARGRPVTDLQAADFEVLEDGVVQPLVWFDRSNAASAAGLPAASAKPPSAAFASNSDLSQGPPQSIFAIVFHQLTTEPRAKATQAAHALVDRLAPGDYAGIYVFDKELRELAAFTRDRGALHGAIRAASMTSPDFRTDSYRRGSAEDSGIADAGLHRRSGPVGEDDAPLRSRPGGQGLPRPRRGARRLRGAPRRSCCSRRVWRYRKSFRASSSSPMRRRPRTSASTPSTRPASAQADRPARRRGA